jgi:hypothetical protein
MMVQMPKAVEEKTVTISKFKATCLSLLRNVKKIGRSLLVPCRKEPVALITTSPKPMQPESWIGMFKFEGKIAGDIISPNFNNDTGRLIF